MTTIENLSKLGYTEKIEAHRKNNDLDAYDVGRVVSEHKDRYQVNIGDREIQAELIGNLRYSANSRLDLPVVGDWVAVNLYDDDKGLIHSVFPRLSVITRKAVQQKGNIQVIGSNIDFAFIIQAVDRDFNINRIQRYLTIANAGNVNSIIILSKIDLISQSQLDQLIGQINLRIPNIPIKCLSNITGTGIEPIRSLITPGKTYCLLGSSGVGKSSLLNQLSGNEVMDTGEISSSNNKGKHVTSHRELVVLDQGGIVIDNPGMRAVGIVDSEHGLAETFEEIAELASSCKFSDCSHQDEKGCAVIEALGSALIDQSSYDNYLKMQREQTRFESSVAERRRKDKSQGKLYKRIIKRKRDQQN